MTTLTFRSKVDTWLVVLMLGIPAVVLGSLVPTLSRADAPDVVTIAVVALLALGLPLWLLANTRYELSRDRLRIVSGPFRWNVRLADITAVTPTRSVLSSPALSLQRLEIRYGAGRSIMISPADPDAFLRALDERRRAAT